MCIGAILQAVGAGLKALVNVHFEFVFAGQVLCGLAQPFIMTAPAVLATQWFETDRRVMAITIGANSNTIGMAIGTVFPTIFVRGSKPGTLQDQIFISNVVQAGIAALLAILALITFQNRPPTPPSKNAAVPRDDNLFIKYIQLFKNLDFVKLCISFGI